jgi:hypothetical protein
MQEDRINIGGKENTCKARLNGTQIDKEPAAINSGRVVHNQDQAQFVLTADSLDFAFIPATHHPQPGQGRGNSLSLAIIRSIEDNNGVHAKSHVAEFSLFSFYILPL